MGEEEDEVAGQVSDGVVSWVFVAVGDSGEFVVDSY